MEELLDFTQAGFGKEGTELKKQDVDLSELMSSILDEFCLNFSNIELRQPDHVVGTDFLDALRSHQLGGNLVANAATHGARGAPVQLTREVAEGDMLLLVRNQGEVIPAALFAAMFEPMIREQEHFREQRAWGWDPTSSARLQRPRPDRGRGPPAWKGEPASRCASPWTVTPVRRSVDEPLL